MYNDIEYSQFVNATCRSKGAVGKNAIVSKYVAQISDSYDMILDYGSGKEAIHTLWLRNLGRCVSAYDIAGNFDPKIHVRNLEQHYYHIVFMSNVINVQPTLNNYNMVMRSALFSLKENGQLIFNFPKSPRKTVLLTDEYIVKSLNSLFKEFYLVNPNIYHFKFYIH